MITRTGWTALFFVLAFVFGLLGLSGAGGKASYAFVTLGAIFLVVAALVSWLLAPRPAKNRTRRNI